MATAVAHSWSLFDNLSFKPASLERTVVEHMDDNFAVCLAHGKMHKKMRKKEVLQQKKRSFRSHADPAYQQIRPTVVDWISQVGEACGLKNLTTHAAQGFVDMLLDITPVDRSRIQLVAVACILISAKIEEQEDRVPRVCKLTGLCGNIFSRELVLRMESWVLNTFKWEMVVLTTINFLEYYLQACLLPSEMIRNPHIRNYELSKAHLCKTAEFFVDLSEHHSIFREYLPSVVATSSIAAARQLLRIQPVWTDALRAVSGHDLGALSECAATLLNYYHQTFPSPEPI